MATENSKHSASIPDNLLVVIRGLVGRAVLRLFLELQEMKPLPLSLILVHILLHRFVRAGFALGEQTFQGLSG